MKTCIIFFIMVNTFPELSGSEFNKISNENGWDLLVFSENKIGKKYIHDEYSDFEYVIGLNIYYNEFDSNHRVKGLYFYEYD